MTDPQRLALELLAASRSPRDVRCSGGCACTTTVVGARGGRYTFSDAAYSAFAEGPMVNWATARKLVELGWAEHPIWDGRRQYGWFVITEEGTDVLREGT